MLANPVYRQVKRSSHGTFVLVSAVVLLALVVGLVCLWLMLQTAASYYATRIYPNVYVMGLNLGRMTPEEATAILEDASYLAETGQLTLSAGAGDENRWTIPWSQVGMHLNPRATAQAAFAVGHADADQRMRDQIRIWLRRHDVDPVLAVDAGQARALLEGLAPQVELPPTDATLRLEGDQVVAVPGRPGRALDVEASLERLLEVAVGQDSQVDLVLQAIPPHIADAAPFKAEAERLLQRQVTLSAYDVLTDETFDWTLGRREIIRWLRVETAADGPAVQVDPQAVQATLAELAGTMGQGRSLLFETATEKVLAALDAGGGHVALYLSHPARTYSVRSGDTISDIATAFGMPVWLILQANPDIDADWLQVGQSLVIPSQDLLTPHLPVRDKRVVVSIEEQRARAYEDGELVFDWLVSTGVADSPTSRGVFQVLYHEENAYASLWDLWMPHFVAIYPAGPDFYNGFHGLPTLSSGRRLWEGLLGSPVSYGCIILGLQEAETFYRWAEVGVVVVVE